MVGTPTASRLPADLSKGTAHSLPVGFRQYGAFPQLDIYIRSFRKIPAQWLKIGLFTQQHFKPDMAFTGHFQDCRHFITVNLPQKRQVTSLPTAGESPNSFFAVDSASTICCGSFFIRAGSPAITGS